MAVIRTDEWLEKNFQEPLKICEELKELFKDDSPKRIYQYLLQFGMYRPHRRTFDWFKELEKKQIWEQLEKLVLQYKKKWQGPDIPVFIFPMDTGAVFSSRGFSKSGVSFRDKMFLFLSPLQDEKEIEALFVHEYHHVCRIHCQKKRVENYTLLDSMVLEGLAEQAVLETCGEKYLAKWSKQYSTKELLKHWNSSIKEVLDCKRDEKIHDDILFGKGKYPPLFGYAIGYEIVRQYKLKQHLSREDSFRLPADTILAEIDF
ncbi:DUF2268 domain-containing protein [Mesobacillus maritimus]|uniref:DUF2268 domain-containing protein n=1 Tax=Mesobacillus maritimus TaxID=1643336 RepID=UPI00203AE323|nr:DUF2268 domain-containing protein [Mesobacillus maritimus]MCM3586144.1 DUF2268 domain-containing protein [Mesobacillus maritimus]